MANKFECILVLATIILIVGNYGCNATNATTHIDSANATCDSANAAKKIEVYELKNAEFSAKITNYGATLISFMVPDKNGKVDDIVLGYESIDTYKNDTPYFGAIVGRVANRIGNAQFKLNGVEYKLPANDHGKSTLHGGKIGFGDVIWTMKSHKEDSHLTLKYDSFDGEQGFPGALSVTVKYLLVGKNKLAIKMEAEPKDKATPVNLASHSYWNLAGHSSGDILSHEIQIFASNITPVDNDLIPTGKITPVEATPFDFLKSATIKSKIDGLPNGYDINYVLDSKEHLKQVAVVKDNASGRKMELWSNQKGVQFYTGGMIGNQKGGKQGVVYKTHAGLCLETQGFPDSVNHPNFPSQIVIPGQVYEHTMIYRFTAN